MNLPVRIPQTLTMKTKLSQSGRNNGCGEWFCFVRSHKVG